MFACFCCCCELTTLLLNQSFLIKEFTKSPIIIGINGLLLWIGFIFFRLLLFPIATGLYLYDLNNIPLSIYNNVNLFEKIFYPTTMMGLFFISSFWMINITKGMKKVMKKMFIHIKNKYN